MIRIKSYDDFRKKWDALVVEVASVPAFEDTSDQAKEARRKTCADSVWEFGRTYFPEYTRQGGAKFHDQWEKVRGVTDEPVLVMAFRGGGKSTYFSFLELLHRICFGRSRFIVMGSYTEEKADIFTGRIQIELMFNPRLIADFGPFFREGQKRSESLFDVHNPYTNTDTRVMAISIGQDPRGLVFGAYRPDCVRLDDIQSSKRAQSKKFVRETINWIRLDLIPALAQGYSLLICATPLNNRCVASCLEKGDQELGGVKTFRYPAEDDKGKPTWPDGFPRDRLESMKRTMGSRKYAQEMKLIPVPLDEAIFKEESIRYFTLDEIQGRRLDAVVSWTDPSHKNTKGSDFKATVCVASIQGVIYVVMVRLRRESISRMIDGMYLLYDAWHPWAMFYEDVGGQALLDDIFVRVATEKGRYLPVQPEGNNVSKEARIEGTLSALVENGVIRFLKNDPDTALLIEQLLTFPDPGVNDDGPDALEGAVRKLQQTIARSGEIATRKVRRVSSLCNGY